MGYSCGSEGSRNRDGAKLGVPLWLVALADRSMKRGLLGRTMCPWVATHGGFKPVEIGS